MRLHQKSRTAFLLLSPWLVTLALFWLYPLVYALFLSFTKYKTLTTETIWIGFRNYEKLFSDPVFLQSLLNTVIFVIGTIPFTIGFALFLRHCFRIRSAFKAFSNPHFFCRVLP